MECKHTGASFEYFQNYAELDHPPGPPPVPAGPDFLDTGRPGRSGPVLAAFRSQGIPGGVGVSPGPVVTGPGVTDFSNSGARLLVSGNPKYLSCFLDENINRQLAVVCRTAHRSVWQARVLSLFAEAEDRRVRPRAS